MEKYKDYMVGDDTSYAEEQYKNMYSLIKINFGIPSFVNPRKLEEIAYSKAESIYKFSIRDSNRNYPFKFYNILNIPESDLIRIINSDIINNIDKLRTRLYQYNFERKNKRISILLITSKNKLYSAYIILNNRLEPIKNIKSIIEYTDISESYTLEKINKINSLASIARMNGIETTNRLRDDIVSEYTDIIDSLNTIDESIIVKDISLLPVYKINESTIEEGYAIDEESLDNFFIEEETEIINESLSGDYQNIMSFNIGYLGRKVYSIKMLKRMKNSLEKKLNKYEIKLKEFKKMNDDEKAKFCLKINAGNTARSAAIAAGSTMGSQYASNGNFSLTYIELPDKITPYNYPGIAEKMIRKLKSDIQSIDRLIKQKEKAKGIKEGYAIDLDSLKYVIESKNLNIKDAIQEIRDVNYIGDTYQMYCVIPKDINENMTLESFITLNEVLINSNITPISSTIFNENEFINK